MKYTFYLFLLSSKWSHIVLRGSFYMKFPVCYTSKSVFPSACRAQIRLPFPSSKSGKKVVFTDLQTRSLERPFRCLNSHPVSLQHSVFFKSAFCILFSVFCGEKSFLHLSSAVSADWKRFVIRWRHWIYAKPPPTTQHKQNTNKCTT